MSGGRFEYKQYHIGDIADQIEEYIGRSGQLIPKSERWRSSGYYEKYPEDEYYDVIPDNVMAKLKEGVRTLRVAHIYAHAIDYYLSGDYGDESFLEVLEDRLKPYTNP